MHTHHEVRHFPYNTHQLYAMVADVAAYPKFLPWCKAARILESHPDHLVAELKIAYKGISESYTSRVHLCPPQNGTAEIRVELIRGPFEHLFNLWQLIIQQLPFNSIKNSLNLFFCGKKIHS